MLAFLRYGFDAAPVCTPELEILSPDPRAEIPADLDVDESWIVHSKTGLGGAAFSADALPQEIEHGCLERPVRMLLQANFDHVRDEGKCEWPSVLEASHYCSTWSLCSGFTCANRPQGTDPDRKFVTHLSEGCAAFLISSAHAVSAMAVHSRTEVDIQR